MPDKNKSLDENSSQLEKVDARTMESDLKSISEQGGGEPKPYTPISEPIDSNKSTKDSGSKWLEKEKQSMITSQETNDIPKPEISEESFQPPQIEPVSLSPGKASPETKAPKKPGKISSKKPNKKIFVIILIAIIAIGLAVALYFAFWPEKEIAPPEEAGVPEVRESIEVPTMPVGSEELPETIAVPLEEEVEPEEIQIVSSSHVSLLSTPADVTVEIELPSLDREALISSLKLSPAKTPHAREVILRHPDNEPVLFSEIAGIFSPTVFDADTTMLFRDDPTVVTYSDTNGTWLILLTQLKADANMAEAKNQVTALEKTPIEINNFFFEDPGQAEGEWKDGGANEVSSRYLTLEATGAALNYGWSNDVLIITTSYSAFQEIVNRL